ncbi:MAG: sulfite exporter TauE/SafE family protein [Patescibacteria group bacterium]
MAKTKEHIYFVKGMHCASCEVLIEKKLLEIKEVKSVEASVSKGQVLIEYEGNKPSAGKLNEIFKKSGYVFSDKPLPAEENRREAIKKEPLIIIASALLLVGIFLFLNKLGLSRVLDVSSKSSLPTFFVFGLLAGISTCAALVGGIILSISKQWMELYSEKNTTIQKFTPHLMFNFGRLISYGVLGALLGLIGSRLNISFKFTSVLIFAISVMMIFLGLQMLGVKAFRKFQFTLPKFTSRYIADESNFKGRYMPFLMGAFTFFLPCGFTIAVQGLALISGNPIQAGLIMLFFALGTTPMLLGIGLSSIKFSSKPHWAYRFSRIAAILVLFFALFNINNQLNVLGIRSLNDIKMSFAKPSQKVGEEGLAPIVNGKQVLKMNASASGYKPNYFKVKVGIPVRWEITDAGTSGCTNAVISRNLFEGQIDLTPGQVSIKEFTPQKSGKYKFSCWMGMISGVIEVVDKNGSNINTNTNSDNRPISSGARGCGCGICER